MMRAVVAVAVVAVMLAGCGTVRERRVLVPVAVDQSFYDPALCGWPKKADYIVAGTDEEAVAYDLAGYAAYRCEREARISAGRRQAEIAEEIAAQNRR